MFELFIILGNRFGFPWRKLVVELILAPFDIWRPAEICERITLY